MPHKAAPEVETEKAAPAEAEPEAAPEGRSTGSSPHQKRKPMTLEEAVLEMDIAAITWSTATPQTDQVSVLVRRRDGHFDLVEG